MNFENLSAAQMRQAADIVEQIEKLKTELSGLLGSGSPVPAPAKRGPKPGGKRRKMSAEARARIAAAQKARWAKWKKNAA